MSRGLVCYFSVLCLVLGVRSQSLISSSVSSAVTHVAVSSNGVFVSTSNELYRFSPSLQQLGDPLGSLGGTVEGLASTVDGEWCVVCTDANGVTCSVYNGSNLAATPNRTEDNIGAASSLVVFTAGSNTFYTGSFVAGDTSIRYRQYGFAGSSLSRTTVTGQQTASSGFTRKFVSGFSARGYAYYVALDPSSGSNRLIRIIRVCNDSIADGFNNQYELTLSCGGTNLFNPTLLPVSVINETLLIALRTSSVHVCSYSLSDINSLMDTTHQSCVVNNTGNKNINWQNSVSCSSELSGTIVSCVSVRYCNSLCIFNSVV